MFASVSLLESGMLRDQHAFRRDLSWSFDSMNLDVSEFYVGFNDKGTN